MTKQLARRLVLAVVGGKADGQAVLESESGVVSPVAACMLTAVCWRDACCNVG